MASKSKDPLAEYRRKRDFGKTREPAGDRPARRGGRLQFVIQKHAATNLHFDLRLELDGVMKSWAVPKGPSLDPSVKRLAMQVEDHPIEYNTFEGIIPAGEYGGGTVMLWDRGTYGADEADGGNDEATLRREYADGKMSVTFYGERIRGSFALVRTRYSKEKPQWLLIKHKDRYAAPGSDIVAEYQTSVATGRTMEEIAANVKPHPRTAKAAGRNRSARKSASSRSTSSRSTSSRSTSSREPGARAKSKIPELGDVAPMAPMLASVATAVPRGDDWTFEPKYDGIRVLAYATPSDVMLITRNGKNKAPQFPEVSAALRKAAAQRRGPLLIDGEIVALNGDSPARFQQLQSRVHVQDPDEIARLASARPAALIAFDLLVDGDESLLNEPWSTRRARLEQRLRHRTSSALRIGETVPGDGDEMLDRARRAGWEGVVAKRTDAPYHPGVRSRDWLKLKIEHRQEFVVGGYTEPRKSRQYIGALLLGYYDDGGKLVYVGHMGGGFTRAGLKEMLDRLKPLERPTSPFATTPPSNEPVHWVEPKVVVEVKFSEWTNDGRLRQPIYIGTRDDKDPKDVKREPESVQEGRHDARSAARKRLPKLKFELTHLDKVFFPADGYTKGDLVDYYTGVADHILPVMADRPLVLKRFPNGIDGKFFFQQNAPEDPPPGVRVERVRADEPGGDRLRFVGGSLATLLYTVQLGCISVDPWHARVGTIHSPDYTIIDLDPGPRADFRRVIAAARWVKEELDSLGLVGVPKTSGASGMHVYLPLPPRTSEETALLVAQLVATRVAEAHPADATVTRAVGQRGAKTVYVDYLQNVRGKTVACAYCVRPVAGAHVSAPLAWDEITDDLRPAQFTMRTMPDRLAAIGDIWATGMKRRNSTAALREASRTGGAQRRLAFTRATPGQRAPRSRQSVPRR
jgi:bifunctional non-homologous end joining protein LigD